jgi:hypothetical protein
MEPTVIVPKGQEVRRSGGQEVRRSGGQEVSFSLIVDLLDQ